MPSPPPLSYDILIIGGGPAGLAAALTLRRIAPHLTVCLLEKARRIGGHALAGALLHPDDLSPLAPLPTPWDTPVNHEEYTLLTHHHALPLPAPWPHPGCRMISLSRLCRTLGEAAETAGADLLPGFAGESPLLQNNRLTGVTTTDMAITARLTLLAEGCRGHLGGQMIRTFNLHPHHPPQTFGLGLKELWEVPTNQPGHALHTLGWPLDHQTHGGGFLYQMQDNRIALGLVLGLDYRNAGLNPYQTLQRWKTHPRIAPLLHHGRPIAFGARCLVEGGWQALPRLTFPGGLLLGDAAGFLDPAKLQGIGGALRSGVIAAEVASRALEYPNNHDVDAMLQEYPTRMAASDWGQELRRHRNVRPAFRPGRALGMIHATLSRLTQGREPWTWTWRQRDRQRLQPASEIPEPTRVGLDHAAALTLAALREGKDTHLELADPQLTDNARFAYPETRYCPGQVFTREGGRLTLHPGNCLHCKTCDIKDPHDAIRWTPPAGGSGPDYGGM